MQDVLHRPRQIPVRFTGDAREYFGIWIVNILLSIVTLGIYSAWAKVRTTRYFYQNTSLDGRRFDYHATGKQILIGRIIVVVALVIYNGIGFVAPALSFVVAAAFLGVLPWLLNRSLRFHAAMTSWSNVRFRFEGDYWTAVRVFLLYPFLCIFTLYLAYPYVARAGWRYRINASRLGLRHFRFESGVGPFYKAFLLAGLTGIATGVVLILVLTQVLHFDGFPSPSQFSDPGVWDALLPVILMYATIFIAIMPAAFVYQAFIRNAVYWHMALEGGTRFRSNVSALAMIGIAYSNAIAIVASLGLLLPWARIRMTRYMAEHTTIETVESPDEFVGAAGQSGSAVGDAYSDIEGIDVGIPI